MTNIKEYVALDGSLAFIGIDGSQTSYTLTKGGGIAASQNMVTQVDALVLSNPAAPTAIKEPPTISSVAPNPFDITTAVLTVTGIGFDAATVGILHFEDDAGGDGNGYYDTCTFVSSTELSAVYGGAGDGVRAPQMYVYYQDTNGVKTNVLLAVNTAGTTLLMTT